MARFRASAGFTERWEHFDLVVADGVATITFARPEKLGALTFDVYADLRDLLAELPHRGDARVVVIAGRGRGFCSGGDVVEIIGALRSMETDELLAFTRMTGAVVKAIRECPLPVIAAVNGVAAGAGAVIALAADLRVLARSASFAFLFTKRRAVRRRHGVRLPAAAGDRAGPGGRAADPRRLGRRRPRGADRPRHAVVADDGALQGAVTALAQRLAGGPALAYSTTKALLTRELDMDLGGVDRARRDDPGAADGQPTTSLNSIAPGAKAARPSGKGDERTAARDRQRRRICRRRSAMHMP